MLGESGLKCGCKKETVEPSNSPKLDSTESIPSANNIADPAVYDWQAQKCCLKQRNEHAFQNGFLTDVVFVVGQPPHKQRIEANKFPLAAGSRFFETLFSEKWTPKSDESSLPEFSLPDDDPVAFAALVRFLYTDDICLTEDTVAEVLRVANKYNIPSLRSRCIDYFLNNLCLENAVTTLSHAVSLEEQKLIDECWKRIDDDTLGAISAECFTDIDVDTLHLILKRDNLYVAETSLFEALIRWSKAECLRKKLAEDKPENQLSVLDGAVSLIRFPLMSAKDFASLVFPSGLLTNEELLSVYHWYLADPKPSLSYGQIPRGTTERCAKRYKRVSDDSWDCGKGADRIGLMSDTSILLIGIGLYGSKEGSGDYQAIVTVTERGCIENFEDELSWSSPVGKELVVYSNTWSYSTNGLEEIHRRDFENPIALKAKHSYEISVEIQGPPTFYGTDGMKGLFGGQVARTNAPVKLSLWDCPYSRTCKSKGQIPNIHIRF